MSLSERGGKNKITLECFFYKDPWSNLNVRLSATNTFVVCKIIRKRQTPRTLKIPDTGPSCQFAL
jgi:hypothetical protein